MLDTGQTVLVWLDVGLPMHFCQELAHCLGVVTHANAHTCTYAHAYLVPIETPLAVLSVFILFSLSCIKKKDPVW